ncbi:YfkD family protein [Aciduricibacillus chroicocephali]|uniref:YfkD family protein n=1 Tax=Aciduricibacillus chroicocephali TaxID=3054939 RepID=A0ABY9L0I8_9BACI|nr:YfkD family protein [Bacillaceae bacterium 44XB]
MKYIAKSLSFLIISVALMAAPAAVSAKDNFKMPNHVLNISKENTFPNPAADQEVVEPSKETKELLESSEVKIENPELVRMLNETTIKPSPVAIGYRAEIYLGHWALGYKSAETSVNWQYRKINMNELRNYDSEKTQKLQYMQKTEAKVKGALTNQINHADDVRKMMLLKAKKKTKLPLAEQAVFGKGTRTSNEYAVPVEKIGQLSAYGAAVNERGEAQFGEVYLVLKGSKKHLVAKNVTKQGIGGWIPVQDHISFTMQIK